jgi:hypothetical protein
MEDERLQSGERTRLACWFRRLAETIFKKFANPGRLRQHARRVRSPDKRKTKKNAGSRFTRDPALVGVSNQTKAELCVTVVSLSFSALSRSKVFTAYPTDDQLIHPKGLAVDLVMKKFEISN